MANSAPIGIFDSGLGGLSVMAAVHKLLPHENLIFYGDSANAPYGTKSPQEVEERCFTITDQLIQQGAKAILIACNTATSVCAHTLREHFNVPIIGMEPALKVACERNQGKKQRIIVAATPLTLKNQMFTQLMARFQMNHTIYKQPCPDMVTLVESGKLGDAGAVKSVLDKYFASYDLNQIDSIVLGCTHFVFYRKYFESYCPPELAIIDGNEGTARHLYDVLQQHDQLNQDDSIGQLTIKNSQQVPAMEDLSWQLLRSVL